jgi:histone deacetylase 1/2
MPYNEYYEYFGPDYTLHVAPSNMENQNARIYLENIKAKLLENLSKISHVPSVPFQERPPDTEMAEQVYICILISEYMLPKSSEHRQFPCK